MSLFKNVSVGCLILLAPSLSLGWNLSECGTLLADMGIRNNTVHRIPHLPEISLAPGPHLAEAANPIRQPVAPSTLLVSNPALLQSYRSAIEYYLRFRSEIESNLAAYKGADRTELERSLRGLTANEDPRSLTYGQYWSGLLAITRLRAAGGPRYLQDIRSLRAQIDRLMEDGLMPLPIFQNEPLSQRDLLLYQSALIAPIQVIDATRMADGRPQNPYEFLAHDAAHASRSDGYRVSRPAELNVTDYPWLSGPDRTAKVAALRRERFETLRDFLENMPGIAERDRPHVVPVLFEIFHEGFEFAPYFYTTARSLPTDLRVLARFLRQTSYNIPAENTFFTQGDYPTRMAQRGIPRESAQRILLALARIPDHPN